MPHNIYPTLGLPRHIVRIDSRLYVDKCNNTSHDAGGATGATVLCCYATGAAVRCCYATGAAVLCCYATGAAVRCCYATDAAVLSVLVILVVLVLPCASVIPRYCIEACGSI